MSLRGNLWLHHRNAIVFLIDLVTQLDYMRVRERSPMNLPCWRDPPTMSSGLMLCNSAYQGARLGAALRVLIIAIVISVSTKPISLICVATRTVTFFTNILRGVLLALTIGFAVGQEPPTYDECYAAFGVPNSAGLTTGARAWSKHAHRSGNNDEKSDSQSTSLSWWGRPRGPVSAINAGALGIFERVMRNASWRNLHWLPHTVLVYEVRVPEGYGMRWSQDRPCTENKQDWVFRGFVEPMMENGHELGWRH